jgi:hypothetical protein
MVKLSLCTPCKYVKGDEVQLYSLLTSVEDGGDWSTLCPSHFTPGEGISTSHLRGAWVGPVGWDSTVTIMTCYRLNSTGIKFPWGWGFLHPSRLGHTQPHYTKDTGSLWGRVAEAWCRLPTPSTTEFKERA